MIRSASESFCRGGKLLRSILFLFLLVQSSQAENADGLLLHFDFNRIESGHVADLSGSGNHGRVHGTTAMRSEERRVIRFDGVDDHVEFPAPTINPETGFTVELWLQADQARFINRSNRDPLLLGDTADLAVDRSFNLRFNRRRQFFFEYGNGVAAGTHFAGRDFFLKGQGQHLVVVLDADRLHFYLDGVHHRQEALHRPLQMKPDGSWKLGGWFAGHMKCLIDDLKIHDRPLSERELSIFAKRELMRRLYAVVVDSDPTHERIIDLHLWDCFNPSAMAYASTAWHGEALAHGG